VAKSSKYQDTDEAVTAMALHFNSKCGLGYSHREVMKKAKSVMKLNHDEWRVKLNAGELKEAHSKGGLLTVAKKREIFNIKRDEAIQLRAGVIHYLLKVYFVVIMRIKLEINEA